MNLHRKLIVTAALAALPFTAMAQTQTPTTDNFANRDVNQQSRIEQGLQSGQLTTQEASRLERQESGVDRMESHSLSNGSVNSAEQARINQAQNRVSQDITRQSTDAQTGNPNSASSRRMQADVQRNVNQEQRVDQGLRSGQLTNREAGRIENGQARGDRMEARAGADGHVGAYEQRRIQGADHRQSNQIHNERHDGQFQRGGNRQSSGYGRQGWGGGDRGNRQAYGNGQHGWGNRDHDFRPTYGNRPNGGFHGGQQAHSFQQHSFAQAGGRRFR